LQQSIDATDRAAVLTRQLLGFSGQSNLRLEEQNPNDIVRELAEMLNPIIGDDIDLQFEFDDGFKKIRADRTMLQQALMSLCINARHAMPDGGRLLMKTEDIVIKDGPFEPNTIASPGRYVMFVVADTGVGMPPEVLERIFEPFFTTKEVGQGTGLGLAIVHGVIHQHGGVVDVESAPGRGTTFKLLLPAMDEAAAIEVAREPAASI
jgi:signal transduction histidine kinase